MLTEISRKEQICNDKEYKILGVRWYTNGLFVKHIKKGSEILANYVYKVEKGDFVYSRLFAWKGSFAIVTDEFDGCYVSNEFPCFKVDETQLNLYYLMWYFNQPHVWDNCLEKSEGSTSISRNRFKVGSFLDTIIPFHTLKEQNDIVARLQFANEKNVEILGIREDSKKHISSLRQSILQVAVQGKLVPQNPHDEPACVLLEKIKAEKDQLIKNMKIKKEKPLPEITEEEIPYDLPNGWEWVRLGEIIKDKPRNGYSPKSVDNLTDVKSLTLTATTSGKFRPECYKYIDESISNESYLWLETGDILIQRSNSLEYVGTSCIFTGEPKTFIYPDLMMKIQVFTYVELQYLQFVLSSRNIREYFQKCASGTSSSMPKINQSTVMKTLIAVPPFNEQKRIVEKVKYLMALYDELEITVEKSKQESELLMQSVLQKAFSRSEKDNNIVDFTTFESDDAEEEWDVAARADGISSKTKAKIEAILDEVCTKKR